LSKLSTLKHQAYQAAKKKNWAQAILFYEQILEQDKNNPTVMNELGDLSLKSGDSQRAISFFLSAAAKYRGTGLLNNAVAIYKKILRYDGSNLNAHWYLSETRASQGLLAEGEIHAVQFLEGSGSLAADIKEIFLKRCKDLFDMYPDSRVIISHLSQVFRVWELALEAARAECLLACMDFRSGAKDQARETIDEVTARVPEVMNYPEFSQWNGLANAPANAPANGPANAPANEVAGAPHDSPTGGASSSYGELSLGGNDAPVDTDPTVAAVAVDPQSETSFADVAVDVPPVTVIEETGFGDVDLDQIGRTTDPAPPVTAPAVATPTEPAAPAPPPEGATSDDDGCFSLDLDEATSSFEDLLAEAVREVQTGGPAVEDLADVLTEQGDESASVDKLSQFLAQETSETDQQPDAEVATIAEEIGSVVGGDDGDDAERLYEMGLVYLEMGLFDQSVESFAAAASDPALKARSQEMWGIALQRADRLPEAIEVFEASVAAATPGSRESHGLLYHLGKAKEKAGDLDGAIACFNTIREADSSFLDVEHRLASLSTV